MMDREYLQDKIRKLIHKEWISEGDLRSIYTILVALPISEGTVSYMLADLAQQIDETFRQLYIQKEDTKNAATPTEASTAPHV